MLFKAKFTTVDGAGRPKATQAIIPTKRKNGVNPPFSRQRAGFKFLFRLPRSGRRRLGRRCRQCVRLGRVRERTVRLDRSIVLERAAHDRPLMGSGLIELLAREMTADLQAIRAAATRRPARRTRTHMQTS